MEYLVLANGIGSNIATLNSTSSEQKVGGLQSLGLDQ